MSPRAECFTPLRLAPLSGILDERSQPDEMPVGAFRCVLNWYVTEERKLCRRVGWGKLLSLDSGYNNSDLHDQLISLQTDTSVGRQPISLLYAALTSTGVSKLIACTESRLYAYNENTANWKLFGDGLGAGVDDGSLPRRRFYCAQVGDFLYFTNDYDKPFSWSIGADSTTAMADLDTIGLTRAGVIWSWHNILFMANVEMDGHRYRNKILWSDLRDGSSFDPAKADSITGSVDLEEDEEILAGIELGNTFLIFTTRRIWEVSIVGGVQSFNFSKRYVPDDNRSGSLEGCLFYRNTLVSDGNRVFYLGEDGVYKYDLYSVAPERVEWIHKATKEMFDSIDQGACDSHIGWYESDRKEVKFSYVAEGTTGQLPTRTLAINTKYPHTSKIDHGFTAVCRWESQARGSLREFFTRYNICSMDELKSYGYGFDKEGLPRVLPSTTGTRITAIKANTARVILGYFHANTSSPTSLTVNATGPKTLTAPNVTNIQVGQYIKVANSGSNYMEATITGLTLYSPRTGDTTSGSPTVATVTTTGLIAGMAITGAGIPLGTIISAVGGSTLTLSQNATATATGVSLSFSGGDITFNTITATGSGTFTSWTVTTANKVSVEDWDASILAGSLCDKLGNTRIADICEGCKTIPLIVMASGTDWCLKQLVNGYYRERCTNPTAVGITDVDGYHASVATYVLDGYDSVLRPGPEHFGRPELEKEINYFEVNGVPEVQTVPSQAYLRLGMSAEIMDPNDVGATILWSTEDALELVADGTSAAEHEAAGTRPDTKPLSWTAHMLGNYLYWELKISGTGGGVCLSSVVRHVRLLCK